MTSTNRTHVRTRSLLAATLLCWAACGARAQSAKCLQLAQGPPCFRLAAIPPWLSFDLDLRGRLEGTTALNSAPSADYVYLLTRIRGGAYIKPSEHLSAYLQFHDTHALGLPLSKVASNMRDTFDLRQGYLQADGGPLRFRAGRQELKYGSERVIGISDWTNNSRTFDG